MRRIADARYALTLALFVLLAVATTACTNDASDATPRPSPHTGFVFQVNDTLQSPSQIIVYDADAHRIAGKFAAPKTESLGRGDRIYTGLQSGTLRTVSVDGTESAPLYTAPDGEMVMGVDLSPDGHMLALEQTNNMAGADDDAVVLLNLDDSHVLETFPVAKLVPDVPAATIADGLRWNSDSRAVTIQLPVSGTSNVPYPTVSQAVLLGVDGSVRKAPLEAMAMLSPDGSIAVEGIPVEPGCVGFSATHTLDIVDLRTGVTLSSVTNPGAGFRPFAWMPDGSGFVYVSSSAYSGCAPGGSDSTYWLLPAHGDARQLPGDPSSQMGDTLAARISWSCGSNAPQHFGEGVTANPGALLGEEATCNPIGGPARLPGASTPTPRPMLEANVAVDGKPAFDAYEATLIGQITLPE
ncbi:hypothetical protein J0H33_03215 [bacterium]|nr:hypothetical protein [bacterium]